MTIEVLVGKTLKEIWLRRNDEIIFECEDGTKYRMFHSSNCCEQVEVEDVNGDVTDLIGTPIIAADERTSRENPEGVKIEYQDSFTWTFYRLSTIKGTVVIRWYGSSNGYYSESVDFEQLMG